MGREVLLQRGAADPSRHIAVIANPTPAPGSWGPMAVVLISREPFSEDDLVRALKAAEDIVRGRERLRPSRPGNLRLYAEESAAAQAAAPVLNPVPERSVARRRLSDRLGRAWRFMRRRSSYG